MAKIQRPTSLPPISSLLPVLQSYNVRTVVAEADRNTDEKEFRAWHKALSKHVSITSETYLPTKTILVDLVPDESDIFAHFRSAKRRGIRRAKKLGVTVSHSTDIDDLIAIKAKSAGLFGFITTYGLRKLWKQFNPDNAAIILAHASKHTLFGRDQTICCGGVLLIIWDKTAYYWIAGATPFGKSVYAPSLLVWEALRVAKKRGCTQFDFLGVWDERIPKNHPEWKGFSTFKEGFGGAEVYYPLGRRLTATPHK